MIKEILGTVAAILFIIIIAAFSVLKIIQSRKKGELCECIGDCEKCKIQCRNNPLYYGDTKRKGELKYEPPEPSYKKRISYKIGMAVIYISFATVVVATIFSMFGNEDARVFIAIGAYLGLVGYWISAIAEKIENKRKNKGKE